MQSRQKRAKKTRGKVAHNPQFGVKYSFIEELDLVEIAQIKQVYIQSLYLSINQKHYIKRKSFSLLF